MSMGAWKIHELKQRRIKVVTRANELTRKMPRLRYSDFWYLLSEVRKIESMVPGREV